MEGKSLRYEGTKPESGSVSLTKDGEVAIDIYDGKYCVTKGFDESEVTIEEKDESECSLSTTSSDYDITKGVNRPRLAQGMTPIKWDESESKWVAVEADDPTWYDYTV